MFSEELPEVRVDEKGRVIQYGKKLTAAERQKLFKLLREGGVQLSNESYEDLTNYDKVPGMVNCWIGPMDEGQLRMSMPNWGVDYELLNNPRYMIRYVLCRNGKGWFGEDVGEVVIAQCIDTRCERVIVDL